MKSSVLLSAFAAFGLASITTAAAQPATPGAAAKLTIHRDIAYADSTDPRQKLVYVIEPITTGAAERIIVTTRTAAARRGDQLPEPFRLPSR